VGLAGAALGALAAGSASQHLAGGTLGLLRDLAICAGLVFAAGVAVVSVPGARAWFR
jgi:hypothetical protein